MRTTKRLQGKLIRDSELHDVMKRLREIVGSDTQIVFKTTKNASRLMGTYNREVDFDGEDDPNQSAIETSYPKRNLKRVRGRQRDMEYIS